MALPYSPMDWSSDIELFTAMSQLWQMFEATTKNLEQ